MQNGDKKEADFSFFGYKIHIQVTTDTKFPVPVSFEITPGNEWDGAHLPHLIEASSEIVAEHGKRIDSLVADAGYDSTSNAVYLMEREHSIYC